MGCLFQFSAALSSGCNRPNRSRGCSCTRFNSQPPSRAAATKAHGLEQVLLPVSILSRPLERLQRRCRATPRKPASGFNSQPPSRAAATPRAAGVTGCSSNVSILSRPLERLQRVNERGLHLDNAVSILSRPLERLQPLDHPNNALWRWRFQFSAALSSGCNELRFGGEHLSREQVSILSRPLERLQRAKQRTKQRENRKFQFSAALSSGCNPCNTTGVAGADGRFNSQPPSRAAATCVVRVGCWLHRLFQFSAALSSGCNRRLMLTSERSRVSILSRPLERLQQAAITALPATGGTVSILSRPLERLQPPGFDACPALTLFQFSAALSSGCNPRRAWARSRRS